MVVEAVKKDGWVTKVIRWIGNNIFRLREHKNLIGYHFYLPINPYHFYTLDFYFFRINIFGPGFVSISFGILGKKGLQIYGGLKYDPTEALILQENDYITSLGFRISKLGTNERVNSMASF